MGVPGEALLLPVLVISSLYTCSLSSDASISNLVFKGCADQNLQDFNGIYKQTLKTLVDALVSQSWSAKFYKTSSGNGSPSAFVGVFQCRGDLSNGECNDCVERTPNLAHKLCGEAIAARIQLNGCYLRYEISGFKQVSGSELLYKVCGSNRASGAGFGERIESALGEIEKGASSGFYAGAYESVYVLGQCEGDLSGGECAKCVKSAVERAKAECGASLSAQIYLQECYITYTYYPNGVPTHQHSFSASSTTSGAGRSPEKTIAIVLGGLVGAGLVMACLLFTKSTLNKKHHSHKYGGGGG